MIDAKQVCEELTAELIRARSKHPKGFNSFHEGYAILLEEVDELWEEVKLDGEARSVAKMRKEAVQIGAMVIRFIQDLCDLARDLYGEFPSGRPSMDVIESEAMAYRNPRGDYCHVVFFPNRPNSAGGRWNCTRPKGHEGDHVVASYTKIFARWQ